MVDRPGEGSAINRELIRKRWLAAARLRPLVGRYFGGLSRPVRKDLALLGKAFVTLTAVLRFGTGS